MIRSVILFSGFFLSNAPAHRVDATHAKTAFLQSDAASPYFKLSYKYGAITTKSGRVVSDVRLRVNLVTNETEFIFSNGISTNLAKGAVKEINFRDTTSQGIVAYKLKTGYPPFDRQTRDHFYVALADGRCSFLKFIGKKITERTNDMDRRIVIQDFETYEEYFFFSNGSIKRWKKDKEFILAELADKQDAVSKFIEENHTNFRSVENITSLVNYYNSL